MLKTSILKRDNNPWKDEFKQSCTFQDRSLYDWVPPIKKEDIKELEKLELELIVIKQVYIDVLTRYEERVRRDAVITEDEENELQRASNALYAIQKRMNEIAYG